MNISLPVSLGEALDKLTILEIKIEKIVDNRKLSVKDEYDILFNNLEPYVKKYNKLYLLLKHINDLIWIMMDNLRDNNLADEEYLNETKRCIIYNDIRFRIKHKINYISGSILKEEKGYHINNVLLNISNHLSYDKMINLIKTIKFISLFYDYIYIQNHTAFALNIYFEDEHNILINKNPISLKHTIDINEYEDNKNILKILNIDYSEFELISPCIVV